MLFTTIKFSVSLFSLTFMSTHYKASKVSVLYCIDTGKVTKYNLIYILAVSSLLLRLYSQGFLSRTFSLSWLKFIKRRWRIILSSNWWIISISWKTKVKYDHDLLMLDIHKYESVVIWKGFPPPAEIMTSVQGPVRSQQKINCSEKPQLASIKCNIPELLLQTEITI